MRCRRRGLSRRRAAATRLAEAFCPIVHARRGDVTPEHVGRARFRPRGLLRQRRADHSVSTSSALRLPVCQRQLQPEHDAAERAVDERVAGNRHRLGERILKEQHGEQPGADDDRDAETSAGPRALLTRGRRERLAVQDEPRQVGRLPPRAVPGVLVLVVERDDPNASTNAKSVITIAVTPATTPASPAVGAER